MTARVVVVAAAVVAALALAGGALAGGGKPTARYVYQPFSSTDLRASIKVESTVDGSCVSGSRASPRRDAWRCRAKGETYDPCFSGAASGPALRETRWVVCPEYFNTKKVTRLNLAKPLPRKGNRGSPTARKGLPWGLLALPYAHQCRRDTGKPRRFRGRRILYTCGQGMLVGKPDRSPSRWTARFLSEGDNPTLYRIRVRIAWW